MDIIKIIEFINKNWYAITFILGFLIWMCDYISYVYWIGYLKYFNIDETVLPNNENKFSKITYYFSWIVFLAASNIISIFVNLLLLLLIVKLFFKGNISDTEIKIIFIIIQIIVCYFLTFKYMYLFNCLVKLESYKNVKENYKKRKNNSKREFYFELLIFNVLFNLLSYLSDFSFLDKIFYSSLAKYTVIFILISILFITFFSIQNGQLDAKYNRKFKFARDIIRNKEYVVIYEDKSNYIVCDYKKSDSKKKLYICNGKYLTITKNNIAIRACRFERIKLEVES